MAIEGIGSGSVQASAAIGRPGGAARADGPAAPTSLTPAESRQLAALKQRDREVRAHEMAHLTAAGGLANGGATFSYQRGPDGVYYAIGGEVSISLREGRTPEETIANARTIKAAALAPADPSAQDRAVAAAASAMEARAQSEQAAQKDDGAGFGAPDESGAAASRMSGMLARAYRNDVSSGTAGFSAQA